MNIDKFLKELSEEVNEIFPTQISPSLAKRSFVYGKPGEQKGLMKSTPQTRQQLVKETDLNNLIPAFETGFEYLIAASYGTPLQQKMISEVKRLQRVVKQTIQRELQKQQK